MSAPGPSASMNPERRLASAVADWRRRARQRAELASLDDRTLRDLGLDRSELSSILAEGCGASEATRRRIVPLKPVVPLAGPVRLQTRPAGVRWASAAAALLAGLGLGGCGGRPSTAPVAAAARQPTTLQADRSADAIYLPGRFPPPSGPVEPLPPQF